MKIYLGSCSIEKKEYLEQILSLIKELSLIYPSHDFMLRGGILKYRSLKEAYQGNLGLVADIVTLLDQFKIKYCVEVYDKETIELFRFADMYQIGSRNMHNTSLLKLVNQAKKPVLFKRHFASSLADFINHSEYLDKVNFEYCLRGIQSMHTQEQRFIPDITDIQRLQLLTNKPIIYDVSHSSCDKRFIAKNLKSALMQEPSGFMLEVHPEPEKALSDKDQQLDFEEVKNLFKELEKCKLV